MEKKVTTLEDVLAQIAEMMKALQNREGHFEVTPELLALVEKLEAETANFKANCQDLFELLDIDIESYKEEVLESSTTRSSDKQLIKRAEDNAKEAQVMKLALSKAIERGRGQKREGQSSEKANKQQMKERRKLFKPLGGDKNWLPL